MITIENATDILHPLLNTLEWFHIHFVVVGGGDGGSGNKNTTR
jgi:hypothetical protein